jgi:hypothetical protein
MKKFLLAFLLLACSEEDINTCGTMQVVAVHQIDGTDSALYALDIIVPLLSSNKFELKDLKGKYVVGDTICLK